MKKVFEKDISSIASLITTCPNLLDLTDEKKSVGFEKGDTTKAEQEGLHWKHLQHKVKGWGEVRILSRPAQKKTNEINDTLS
jgi:hypothetical protein